jgi:RNA polymerase sigma factor (sigma-70 family)
MKKKKEGLDNWRYYWIGDKDWIVNNFYSYNPEDKIIEALDSQDANKVFDSLVSEEQVNIFEVLENLEPRYKDIVWEYYFEGRTLSEIGSSRGFTKQYAHQELKKAIKLIKQNVL